MSAKSENVETNASENNTKLTDTWAIRPCHLYKEEYDDCTSFKARFHQYFIHGKDADCSQWLKDLQNCERYERSNGNDIEAGAAIIKSEEQRRITRLRAHYANDTWTKRKQPPEDWAKPLPEWLEKRNENTYLEIKQKELSGLAVEQDEQRSFCVIM
ncbi:synaptic plasticity regulator PANTS [Drosophila montana]|uniref:synaptic plasticity regulator PANTS n=1 Tax=Drosophila montana TaxID=40370 RepID=UPI00313E2F6F